MKKVLPFLFGLALLIGLTYLLYQWWPGMDVAVTWLQGHIGTLVIVLVCAAYIVAALWPSNWKYIRTRWVGVLVSLGRISQEMWHEGPQHIWSIFGIQKLPTAPNYQQQITFEFKFLTGGDNPLDVSGKGLLVLAVADLVASLVKLGGQDPIAKTIEQTQALLRSGVQSMDIDRLMAMSGPNSNQPGGDVLQQQVLSGLQANSLIIQWGVTITDFKVLDLEPNPVFTAAAATRTEASARADATRVASKAEVDTYREQRAAQGEDWSLNQMLQAIVDFGGSLKPGVTFAGDLLTGLQAIILGGKGKQP